jgi:hypothetical protein
MSRDLKKITKQMDEFNKEAQENNKNTNGISKAFKGAGKWIGAGAAAMASMKALKFGNELAKIGREAELVNKNFEQFAKNNGKQAENMMNDLRKASMGFVDDMALQQSAIQAMASGVSFDDLTTSMEFVSKFALATGKNVTDLMRTTMTGLARGSAPFLDDIGIMVQGADDVVGAAVEQMQQKMGQFADVSETAAARSKRFEAEISSLKQEIGQGLVPAQANMLKIQKEFFQEITDNKEVMRVFAEGIGNITQHAADLAVEWGHIISGLTGADIQAAVEVQSQSVNTLERAATLAEQIKTIALKGGDTEKMKSNLAFMLGAQGDYNKLVGQFGVEANQKYAKTEMEIAKAIRARATARAIQVDQEDTDKMLADAKARETAAKAQAQADAEALRVIVDAERKAGAARGAQMEKDINKRKEVREKAQAEALTSIQDQMAKEAQLVWEGKKRVEEAEKAARDKELQEEQSMFAAKMELANNFENARASLMSAAFQGKMNNLEAEKRADIQAVKVSTMSEKKKNEEIAKIEEKSRKESLKIRTAIWGSNLTAAGANTALAVTNALADPTPMPTALRVAQALGVGALGLGEVAQIAANKPKFANGGIHSGTGVVAGTSLTGDQGNARINAGEAVINPEQFNNAFNNPNGNTTNDNSQRVTNVYLTAMDTQGGAEAVVGYLEHAQQNNMIDESVLNVAAL